MNRKQKMIVKMWRNYKHNCDMQRVKPLYKYNVFKNVYRTDSFEEIFHYKNWYKEVRI